MKYEEKQNAGKRIQEIFLVLPRSHLKNQELLRGIYEYAYPSKSWAMFFIAQTPDSIRDLHHTTSAAGLIGRLGREDLAEAAAELNIPVVNIHGGRRFSGLVQIGCDMEACGRFAAKNLQDCGVPFFGFYGLPGEDFSDRQQEGFTSELHKKGFKIYPFSPQEYLPKIGESSRKHPAVYWLQELPKPIAIYCPTDVLSHELANYCLQARLDIPREVLILGVDNDEILCHGSQPPLSSIRQPYRMVGRKAAELLDSLMAGEPPPEMPCLMDSPEIVERQSTLHFHTGDPIVEKALQWMREEIGRGISVKETAKAIGISPRVLELRFRKTLGMSPQRELQRLRVELIKTHLRNDGNSLERIAEACGLSSGVYISQFFQRETGMTPGQYRKIFQ